MLSPKVAHPSAALAEQRLVLRFGPYRFDFGSKILSRGGDELSLPPRAIGVLEILLERPGDVVSKDELVARVWGDTSVTDQSPAEAVRVIREALGDDSHHPEFIQTVHRRGYRFIAEVTPQSGAPDEELAATVLESASPASWDMAPVARVRMRRLPVPVWITLGIVLGFAVASVWSGFGPEPRGFTPLDLRVPVALPSALVPSTPASLAISPDGMHVVYRAGDGETSQLYLLHLEQFEGEPLPGTEGGFGPFFSPDGRWVGYFTEGRILKVSLRGGAPMELGSFSGSSVFGATWLEDSTIVFASGPPAALRQIPEDGGEAIVLAEPRPERAEYSYAWPRGMVGGNLLFAVQPIGMASADEIAIAVLEMPAREVRILLGNGGTQPMLLANDYLLFARTGALFAAPFDRDRLEVTGPAEPVVGDVLTIGQGASQYAVSDSGITVYVPSETGANASSLVWIDEVGGREKLQVPAANFGRHRFAPDHSAVALAIEGDIWLYGMERGTLSRFTTHRANEVRPVFTPTGEALVYGSNRAGPYDLYTQKLEGPGPPELLLASKFPKFPDAWTPDGTHLVYTEIRPETGQDIWVVEPGGEAEPRPLVQTPFAENQARVSPDGSLLAYVSNESGRFEVWVRPLWEPLPHVQVSFAGGRSPEWAPDGNALYFNQGDAIYQVSVPDDGSLKVSAPRHVVDVPNTTSFYSVGPDGRRFLVGLRTGPPRSDKLHLIGLFDRVLEAAPDAH